MTELVSIIPESSTFCQVKMETSPLKGKLPKKTHLFHSHPCITPIVAPPFYINISNNAKDENISVRSRAIHAPLTHFPVRSRAIHAPLTFKMSYTSVSESFLKLTAMVRFPNRTFLYQHLKFRRYFVNLKLNIVQHRLALFVNKKRAGFPPLPEGRGLQPED